jgi:hydrogenase 3 maturation protease
MWPSPWLKQLSQILNRHASRAAPNPVRVAVVGIGQTLRGDDGLGCAVALALQSRLPASNEVLVLEAGPAPENATGRLRQHRPTLVLLVDAAQMNAAPGSVQYLAWEETIGMTASSHTLPLHLLAEYLTSELGCEVFVLGIQPAQTGLGAPLSPVVAQAIETTAASLAQALNPSPPGAVRRHDTS